MNDRFWLIQRGSFNDPKTATEFLGGSAKHLINPDYMGAAEFEFGAIPKAYRRILGQYDQFSLHKTDMTNLRGVPLYLFCKDTQYELILAELKVYIRTVYHTKEWTNMEVHFNEELQRYGATKHKLKTNFWWCIDISRCNEDVGDWIAFLGATDRVNALKRILDKDYKEFWMKKSAEEREEELKQAFKFF